MDGPDPGRRTFERWGLAAYLVAMVAVVGAIVVHLGGTLVYVLDDAAIHLGMADNLVEHRTWGVAPGSFESASSSPVWTLLVAAGLVAAPGADQWVPLVFNGLAGVAVLVVLGRNQIVLRPARDRPLDLVATGVLVVGGLFLPGLAVVGMEHTLQVALVLGAVVLVQRRRRGWLPYLVLAVASLVRFETIFVGVGLAAGVALDGGLDRATRRDRGREIVGLVLAAVAPVAAFGLWNRAMGGGWLPNSVLSKGQGVGASNIASDGTSLFDLVERLTSDPLVVVLVVLAVTYLAATWGRPAGFRITAVALVVAAVLHAGLADVGWYERYQAYLIAIGLYLALGVIGELPSDVRRRAVLVLTVVTLVMSAPKISMLVKAPAASDDMYRQQYQAGQFLGRYYDGASVATDQLGYISLFHDGPLTDFGGLGDYEVLQHHMPATRAEAGPIWARVAEERGVQVVVFYDVAGRGAPATWVLAGIFRSHGQSFTGVSERLQFWATSPDEVRPLQAHLREYEAELPDRVTLELNDWAEYQAARIEAESPD